MGFAESRTGQILIQGHRKAKDRGLQVVILLYGIARENPKKMFFVFAVLVFLSGLLVANLDAFILFVKKLTLLGAE